MGSSTISDFSEVKFKRFVAVLPELDLELPVEGREYYQKLISAPSIEMISDFQLVYKNRYLINFEYMERCLEFYAIGERQNDEFLPYKTTEGLKEAESVNQELEYRIIDALHLI